MHISMHFLQLCSTCMWTFVSVLLSLSAVINAFHHYFSPVWVVHVFPLGPIVSILTGEEVRIREVKSLAQVTYTSHCPRSDDVPVCGC